MSGSVKMLMALVLAGSLAAMPGCSSWKNKKGDKKAQTKPTASASKEASDAKDASDDDFARGAKRPPTPRTLFALAQILEAQGKDDQAEQILGRIISEEPRFLPAYCELAELRMRQRRVDDAYSILSDGLKVTPDDAILLNNRGMCQVLLKEYEGALANFTRASALRPDDARYRSNMAMSLGMLGRYDESYSLYVLVMSPKEARENLAVLAEANGDKDRAEQFRHGKKTVAKAPVAAPAPVIVAVPIPAPVPVVKKPVSIVAIPATQPILATEIIDVESDGEMNSESVSTSTPAPARVHAPVSQPEDSEDPT